MPVIPLGYTFGRLGNFINGELYGRITSLPIGMYFPTDPARALRHPSQLYEALFEGLFLFGILWRLRKVPAPRGAMLAFYLIGYGSVALFDRVCPPARCPARPRGGPLFHGSGALRADGDRGQRAFSVSEKHRPARVIHPADRRLRPTRQLAPPDFLLPILSKIRGGKLTACTLQQASSPKPSADWACSSWE